jgi:hypothetical protein
MGKKKGMQGQGGSFPIKKKYGKRMNMLEK